MKERMVSGVKYGKHLSVEEGAKPKELLQMIAEMIGEGIDV